MFSIKLQWSKSHNFEKQEKITVIFRIYVEKAGILEDRKKFLPARASDF